MTHLLAIALLLVPGLVFADVSPPRERVNNKCSQYTFCDQKGSAGVAYKPCTDGSQNNQGDEVVLRVGYWAHYTFAFFGTDDPNYECQIHTNHQGHDATSGVGDVVNTATLDDKDTMYTMRVLLDYVWVECRRVSVGQPIEVKAIICPI